MKFKLMTALFAFLALTLVGCGGANSAGPTDIGGGANGGTLPQASPASVPTGTIQVVDAVTGSPVSGATITFADGVVYTTDAQGLGTVGVLAAGQDINIEAPNYARHLMKSNSAAVYKLVRNDSEFTTEFWTAMFTGYAGNTLEVVRLPITGAKFAFESGVDDAEVRAAFEQRLAAASALFQRPFTLGSSGGAVYRVRLDPALIYAAGTGLTTDDRYIIVGGRMIFQTREYALMQDVIAHEFARAAGFGGCNPDPGLLSCIDVTADPSPKEITFFAMVYELPSGTRFEHGADGKLLVIAPGR